MQEALAPRDPLANGSYHRSQPIVLTGQPVAVFTLTLHGPTLTGKPHSYFAPQPEGPA